jgi:NAD(P)-dependent dehydrogenase (short-subunit alcohol dehydrogenase family)
MNLRGRVALITGGAGHLGRAFGAALAECGAAIAVLDLRPENCQQIAAELATKYAVKTLPLAVDLQDEAALKTVPEQIQEQLGRLDVLVNCAMMTRSPQPDVWDKAFEQQTAFNWRLEIEINLTAAMILTQACVPLLRASGHGAIINISSIYGMVAPDFRVYAGTEMGSNLGYAMSKGGLVQATRYLASALAPDIRVNTITPGGVFRHQAESFVQHYVQRTPLGRMATEEDLIGAVVYLASDLAAYVTGQNVVVDGGWTVW